jgi:hypothetical protein
VSFSKFFNGLRLRRPQTVAQLPHTSEETHAELRDLARTVAGLRDRIAALTLREEQLRAVLETDTAMDHRLERLEAIPQRPRITAHVAAALERATLRDDPFPHAIVDDFLPDSFYDALIMGLPPTVLFADRPVNKQQLTVPFDLAPRYSRRVWGFMADVVAEEIVAPAIIGKFRTPTTAWLMKNFPQLANTPLESVGLRCSDGRIMLRRPGYVIRPHRDPKWGFLTCLMYLARPGDDERWGTQLYHVDGDDEARGAAPHWIDETRCRPAGNIEFRRNRAFIFLNSVGAHGANIPADAQPADLERYAYQFRIGAGPDLMRRLTESLPPERCPLWEAKVRHVDVATSSSSR